MHYPQLPDLTSTGMDVNATFPKVLADDFLCTSTGPITDIHIWGSWLNDNRPPVANFRLSIHADIPAGPNNPYSRPGEQLWPGPLDAGEWSVSSPIFFNT